MVYIVRNACCKGPCNEAAEMGHKDALCKTKRADPFWCLVQPQCDDRSERTYFTNLLFTARGYAKRGICRRRVCVCLCVCHTPVLYQNGYT